MANSHDTSDDKETELTMCDVLEEEKELEDDCNAVLGGSDDNNCSYDQGYVPRQALYACMSCTTGDVAGICLACCYACHDKHEIVELYTKRNFRCDCGNSKFKGKKCTLRPDKEYLNSKNEYNQNFKGLYCSCSRPYPDLDDSTPDEMIQCVVCEDWYHARHLGGNVPEDYFEMICSKCMDTHSFLLPYLDSYDVKVDVDEKSSLDKSLELNKAETDVDLKQTFVQGNDLKCENTEQSNEISTSSVKEENLNQGASEVEGNNMQQKPVVKLETSKVESVEQGNGLPHSVLNIAPIKTESNSTLKLEAEEKCLFKDLDKNASKSKGAAFWPGNWRNDLCHCSACMDVYRNANCEFLLNPDDTIEAYEKRGKGKSGESQYDKGLAALSTLDRVKQIEAIHAYTSMKGQLKEYLKDFADNKRTVKETDIKEFFEKIKKQKLNNGIPHFCR